MTLELPVIPKAGEVFLAKQTVSPHHTEYGMVWDESRGSGEI